MGTTKVESDSTQQASATAEETELNKLRLEQQRAIQPFSLDVQKSAFELSGKQLRGEELPGALAPLTQGIEAGQIPLEAGVLGEDITSEIVQNSLRDLFPQLQASGIPLESGVASSIAARTAGDIRLGTAESNLDRQLGIREANLNASQSTQFQNMSTLLNLLNLAVGGQAQIQAPVISTGGQLASSLAGLRTNRGNTVQSRNPFQEAFFSSLGNTLGSPEFSVGGKPGGPSPFSFGG